MIPLPIQVGDVELELLASHLDNPVGDAVRNPCERLLELIVKESRACSIDQLGERGCEVFLGR